MIPNNDQSFDAVLKAAERELTLQYYHSKPQNVYALIEFGGNPLYRSQVIDFIKNGFDVLRQTALAKKAEDDKAWNDGYETKAMINHVILGALGRAAGLLGAKELAGIIFNEFLQAGNRDAFYELTLEAGTLAIALSALDYEGDLEKFQTVFNRLQRVHKDKEFILEICYGLWMIQQDKIKPIEYLKDSSNTKNISLVVTAIADLDLKEALPMLKEKLLQLKNPVSEEVFLEAIHRLEQQTKAPAASDRMIWMFGKSNTTMAALGNETDNEFILRAVKKTKNNELGIVYEVDDSSPEDI